MVASRPYLGEDLCATLRLGIDNDRELKIGLEKKIFSTVQQTTPLKVKAILNEALLKSIAANI